MNREWIDVSNYSEPFTDMQLAFLRDTNRGVCIGLQDAGKARDFKAQVLSIGVPWDVYVERPNRHIEIAEPGMLTWIDIEPGCFTDKDEANRERSRIAAAGLTPGFYGNKYSIQAVVGSDYVEWSKDPLWYANYPNDHHVPAITEFVPFNGWLVPEGWQYSSGGIADINCDLSVEYEVVPMPPTPQPSARQWIYGNEVAGAEERGLQTFYWHRGVEVDAVGDYEGKLPGAHFHHAGDDKDGKPIWVEVLK